MVLSIKYLQYVSFSVFIVVSVATQAGRCGGVREEGSNKSGANVDVARHHSYPLTTTSSNGTDVQAEGKEKSTL